MTRRGIVIVVSLVVGGVIALWPVRVSFLGFSGSCGPALVAVARGAPSNAGDVDNECASEGAPYVGVGVLAAVAGVVAGVIIGPGAGRRGDGDVEAMLARARWLHRPVNGGACVCGAGEWPCPTASALGAKPRGY